MSRSNKLILFDLKQAHMRLRRFHLCAADADFPGRRAAAAAPAAAAAADPKSPARRRRSNDAGAGI